MAELRQICSLLFAVAGCATAGSSEINPYYESSKFDGHPLRLREIDHDKLHVAEPSDLVISEGNLYTVSDAHSKIYQISRGGNVKDEIDVRGHDLEAIAVDPRTGEFVIADESSAKIWFVDADGERTASIEIEGASDGNSGIEGLAYDDDGNLYVAKEKNPARIWKLDEDGREIDRKKITFASDLSALTWRSEDGHLYALSDEEHTLFRLDHNFDADVAWRLPIKHPEGIAFEGSTLYVVSDSEERIYKFELSED